MLSVILDSSRKPVSALSCFSHHTDDVLGVIALTAIPTRSGTLELQIRLTANSSPWDWRVQGGRGGRGALGGPGLRIQKLIKQHIRSHCAHWNRNGAMDIGQAELHQLPAV